MAHFVKIELIGDLDRLKLNTDNIISVKYRRISKEIEINFINGPDIILVEGIHISDAKKTFDKFPS